MCEMQIPHTNSGIMKWYISNALEDPDHLKQIFDANQNNIFKIILILKEGIFIS